MEYVHSSDWTESVNGRDRELRVRMVGLDWREGGVSTAIQRENHYHVIVSCEVVWSRLWTECLVLTSL